MPRYYFHLSNGLSAPDEEGLELPDLGTARAIAAQLVGQLLIDDSEKRFLPEDWRLLVADGDGRSLFSMRVATDIAAAGAESIAAEEG